MINIHLHPGQQTIYRSQSRIRTAVMGRRFGKSRLGINELILRSLSFPGAIDPTSPETTLGVMPTLKQAKKVLWKPLVSLCTNTELSGAVESINRTDYTITWKHGKPPIVIAGANDSDGDRIRGFRIWYLLGDEYQDWKPGIFDSVVQPAMTDTEGSRALLTGTPKGKLNHLYEMYQRASRFPEDYQSFNMPTSSNPTIPRSEIERARLILPPRLYRQEYEASFEDFPGKIYYELDNDLNRCDSLPSGFDLTVMGIDFGDINPAFVIWGRRGSKWYWCEGWQGNYGSEYEKNPVAQPLQDAQILRLARTWKPRITLADPSRPSAILGIRALGIEHGLPGLSNAVGAFNRIEEGLNQVHSLIYQRSLLYPRSSHKPHENSVSPDDAFGLFEAYHRKIDKDGRVTEAIEGGQDDHCPDATRYALSRSVG
jgi:hypothetical protein